MSIQFATSEEPEMAPENNSNKDYYELIERIEVFLDNCYFMDFYNEMRKDIIGQDKVLMDACARVYHYIKTLFYGEPVRNNFFLTAPSGYGKTQFFRSLNRVLNEKYDLDFPIVYVDLSAYTEGPYIGKKISDIYIDLLQKGSITGEAIVFFDEFDKKVVPSFNTSGHNMNAALQGEMLTLIDGNSAMFMNPKTKETREINTENTFFIGLGSFQSIRNSKMKEMNKSSIGFDIEDNVNKEKADIYMEFNYSDILEAGAIEELVGRFGAVLNFTQLTDKKLIGIAKKYVSEIHGFPYGARIKITKKGAKDFLQFKSSPMGIREIRRRIDETLQEDLIKLYSDTSIAYSYVEIVIHGYKNTKKTFTNKVKGNYKTDQFVMTTDTLQLLEIAKKGRKNEE